MKRGGPLQRRTPLVARTALVARTPLARSAPVVVRRRKPDVPTSVRAEVEERSGGICECGCGRRAEHVHHRKLRSQGGRHELVNLLHLTHECHARVHAHPEVAYRLGFLVHGWAEPADVPVRPWTSDWRETA